MHINMSLKPIFRKRCAVSCKTLYNV